MLEKTQSFDMNGQDYEGIQQKIEKMLQKDLKFSTNTTRLGNSLIRINYYNNKLDMEKQRENRITILREPKRRIYIQIKGKLNDEQIGRIWLELERGLKSIKNVKEKRINLPSKEDIIYQIIELIKLKGYSINYSDAKEFLENFNLKYGRLPKKEEISSIVQGYTIMINEDCLSEQAEISSQIEPLSNKIPMIIEGSEEKSSINSHDDSLIIPEAPIERKRCPCCGNEGLIHEIDDKNNILMDYPRILGKKNHCAECGYEWRS